MLRILSGLFLGVFTLALGCGAEAPTNTAHPDMDPADLGMTDQAVFSGPDMVTTLPIPVGCDTNQTVTGTLAYKTLTNGVTGNGARCMGGCHNGTNLIPKFSTQATFMTATINQSSTSDLNYITPNNPSKSYVLYKLAGKQGTVHLGGGVQMPRNATPLTAAEQCTIYNWVLHGAPTT